MLSPKACWTSRCFESCGGCYGDCCSWKIWVLCGWLQESSPGTKSLFAWWVKRQKVARTWLWFPLRKQSPEWQARAGTKGHHTRCYDLVSCQGFVFLLPPGGPRAGNPTWYVMYGMAWYGTYVCVCMCLFVFFNKYIIFLYYILNICTCISIYIHIYIL